MEQKRALNEAITLAGGLAPFAEAVRAPSVHAVKAWRLNQVPEIYCPRIERVYGIKCERLRPDVEWSVLRVKAET